MKIQWLKHDFSAVTPLARKVGINIAIKLGICLLSLKKAAIVTIYKRGIILIISKFFIIQIPVSEYLSTFVT